MNEFSSLFVVPVDTGHNFVISGRSTVGAEKVAINLATDRNYTDYLLHFSIRYRGGEIVRNSKNNNRFEREERSYGASGVGNPFYAGEIFHVSILVGADRFRISTNNDYYCDFLFRGNPQFISVLQIDCDIDTVHQVDHQRVLPYHHPLVQDRFVTQYHFSADMPVHPIPGLVIICKAIAIGSVSGNFIVRFLDGINGSEALHFDARFSSETVIRNHTCNDMNFLNHIDQENYGVFPFFLNSIFKIAFGFGSHGFQIAVNGNFFCEYRYRTRMENIGGLKVLGYNGIMFKVFQLDHFILDTSLNDLRMLSIL